MIWFLAFKLAILAYAGYESIKARYRPGIGVLVTVAYLTLARLASLLPPYPSMPLRETLALTWWLYPVLVLGLSLGPMIFAFLGARDLREDDPRHAALERVGFAFLANVLLDAAVLVIVAIGLVLVARDA